jgi:hypothetical protein
MWLFIREEESNIAMSNFIIDNDTNDLIEQGCQRINIYQYIFTNPSFTVNGGKCTGPIM